MKYIVISVLQPGVDNAKKALEVFSTTGTPQGTEALYVGSDGKTFITIVESDTPDMATSATYAPFMESVTVVPVVAVDDAWMQALQKALAAWG